MLRGTATVVRHWGDVDNLGDFDSHVVEGSNGALASAARTFHEHLHLLQAMLHGFLATILCCALCGIGCVLFRSSKSHLARTRPGNNLPCGIGEGDDDVVEGGVDVGLAHGIHFDLLLAFFGGLGHRMGS